MIKSIPRELFKVQPVAELRRNNDLEQTLPACGLPLIQRGAIGIGASAVQIVCACGTPFCRPSTHSGRLSRRKAATETCPSLRTIFASCASSNSEIEPNADPRF